MNLLHRLTRDKIQNQNTAAVRHRRPKQVPKIRYSIVKLRYLQRKKKSSVRSANSYKSVHYVPPVLSDLFLAPPHLTVALRTESSAVAGSTSHLQNSARAWPQVSGIHTLRKNPAPARTKAVVVVAAVSLGQAYLCPVEVGSKTWGSVPVARSYGCSCGTSGDRCC